MATVAEPRLLTTADLLAMPEDGVRRWLINGQLREERTLEGGKPTTLRSRWHGRIMAHVAAHLENWRDRQAEPRGAVMSGEVGVRLRRDPDTTVGVDVIYVSPELAAHEPTDTSMVDGVPVLAVEILSPSTTQATIDEKIGQYLQAGVKLVWVIHPRWRTVEILRPDGPPAMVNDQQELSGEPHLPGFRVPVAQIFA
jgi:Uma2 family endonuclease